MDDPTRHLLAARAGDRNGLAALVRETQEDVWRLCASLVDRQSADDLAQDVYVAALAAAAGFRGDASARVWLLAIARRICVDEIRRRQRRRSVLARVAVPGAVHEDDHGSVELAALLDVLDDDRRAAFVLTQVVGLTYTEAAAACEVPVGTIRSRVARAREDLVRTLGTERVGGT